MAAGAGTRMKSSIPKVLQRCCGVPLINHVVRLTLARRCSPIVVVVSPDNGDQIREVLSAGFPETSFVFATQTVARGTGDATRVGLEAIPNFKGQVLILSGDVPLIQAATLARLHRATAQASLGLLTAEFPEMKGYGRVVRRGKLVSEVVEEKDASVEVKAINEGNAGVYQVDSTLIRHAVDRLKANNAQGEFYLTDVVAMAAEVDRAVPVLVKDWTEVSGVNTREQLAVVEGHFRARMIAKFQSKGVTFLDPDRTFIGAEVSIGKDVVIGVGVQLYGATTIKSGARIDGPTFINNARIESGARIHSFSHIEDADVGKDTSVGPYARLRPAAILEAGAKVGNFVEVKRSRLGRGVKVNHLAYIGDATIGAKSNVGAGTITCNYDGMNKSPTVLGKNVFIGSNSTLVAPIELGDGAYVAAGSTITKSAPSESLVFGRARQANRDGYAAVLKERLRQRRESKTKES